MDLSIIIVSFNTKQLLKNCLDSVFKSLSGSRERFEVIVVDNISTDGTREMLDKRFPAVRTILNKENVGFGRANNQGIKAARGDYVLLLNSDTIVVGDAIAKLLTCNKEHPVSFVGAKLLNPDLTPQTSCGPFFTLPVIFGALFLKGDHIGITRWSPTRTRLVDWVSGACLLGPRRLFLDGLLFDEKIFMYMEEVDLLYRARQKGYETYFYPGSSIIHVGGGSSPTKRKGPVLNIYRGLLYFYAKHRSRRELFLLQLMLRAKAVIAWSIGMLTGNDYLRTTYAEAYQLV